jgi:hypothetical protein
MPESGTKRRRLLERHQAVPGHRSLFNAVDLIAQLESMQWYAEISSQVPKPRASAHFTRSRARLRATFNADPT